MSETSLSPDPADTLADVFSIHHLVWLWRNDHISDAPYELGPWPASMDFANTGKFDARLKADLLKWGIISESTGLHPDAKKLFEALVGNNEWSLWGTILLYALKTNATETFDPEGNDEWGLKYAVRDVPRVKFVIAVTEREIITALNAPPQLVLNRVPRVGPVHKQVGETFQLMLDPTRGWKPWKGPKASLPWRTVNDLSKNPETSTMTDDDEGRAAQSAVVKNIMSEIGVSPNTSKVMESLVKLPSSAAVRAAISMTSPRGRISPDVGLGVTFYDDEDEGGVVVSYPVGKHEATRSIRYVPGDTQGFIDGVAAMVELAESLDEG